MLHLMQSNISVEKGQPLGGLLIPCMSREKWQPLEAFEQGKVTRDKHAFVDGNHALSLSLV